MPYHVITSYSIHYTKLYDGAIANGILKSGYLPASSISISDPREKTIEALSTLGFNAYLDNTEAAKDADLIIFAVKPYHIEGVIANMKEVLTSDKILVSIVAGVSLKDLSEMAGDDKKIFRVMPNT